MDAGKRSQTGTRGELSDLEWIFGVFKTCAATYKLNSLQSIFVFFLTKPFLSALGIVNWVEKVLGLISPNSKWDGKEYVTKCMQCLKKEEADSLCGLMLC